MNAQSILKSLQDARRMGGKLIAVLADPDKTGPHAAKALARRAADAGVDLLMAGGSLMVNGQFERCVEAMKAACDIPVLLFPGDTFQVCEQADGILLLSLISGRNPELLIGRHVVAAPALRRSGLEIIPTGYMLIDGGAPTSVSYMSNTLPIPADKPDIAMCTAMAGEMLGLHAIYLDAGSGAAQPVPAVLIEAVRTAVDIPLIVGGGLRHAGNVQTAFNAGADMVVLGSAFEQRPEALAEVLAPVRDAFPALKV